MTQENYTKPSLKGEEYEYVARTPEKTINAGLDSLLITLELGDEHGSQ